MSDLLELAVGAHGGMERWRDVNGLDFRLSLTGGLFRIKAHPHGLEDVAIHVDARQPSVSITPYSRPDASGHFTPDRVWIEDQDGRVLEQRTAPRASFAGHVLQTPWDQLQRLYFTSYALWNYLTTPFLLSRRGFELSEMEPHVESGEVWRRLQARFPADVPTHCAEQVFYFNDKGLLQRLDYVTDIAGGMAAHYCYDHEVCGGLVIPTLRRVVRRTLSGPALSGPTAVLLQITNVSVA